MRRTATLQAPTHGGRSSGRTGRPSSAGRCRRSPRPASGCAPVSGLSRRPRYGSRLLVVGCSRLFSLNAARRIRRAPLRFRSNGEEARGLPRGHARRTEVPTFTPSAGSLSRFSHVCAAAMVATRGQRILRRGDEHYKKPQNESRSPLDKVV